MGVEDTQLMVPTSLGEAGPFVRSTATDITLQLEELARQLSMLPETWSGDQALAFEKLKQDWNLAAMGLFGDGQTQPGILGHVATKLDHAWYVYVTTQQGNTKRWTQ